MQTQRTSAPAVGGGLARLDLRRLFVDVESLLGRAAAAGMETGHLLPRFADTLMAWLRARALDHARRHRTGIALGRDNLRRGVERAWSCLDVGLHLESGGDVEAAVACLAVTKLQALHDRGYEAVFLRLTRMAAESQRLLADERALVLLPQHAEDLRTWSRLVPEIWTAPGQSRDDVDVAVDPVAGPAAFERVRAELAFAASLPRAAAARLLQDEPDYEPVLAALLRRVWTALLLGRESLGVDEEVVRALAAVLRRADAGLAGTDGDAGRPGASGDPALGNDQTLAQARAAMDSHLARAIDDEAQRQRLWEAAQTELRRMSRAAAADGRQLRSCLRPTLLPDGADSARQQALGGLDADAAWDAPLDGLG